jgi:hypothetical protein
MGRRAIWLWYLLGVLKAVALAAPVAARADVVLTRVGTELRFSSGSQDAENLAIARANNSLNCNPHPTPCLQFANGPQKITDGVAGADCRQLLFNGEPFDTIVVCTLAAGTSILLDVNDGDDFVRMGDNVPPATMNGGSGEDHLSAANRPDTIHCDEDGDTIVDDDSSAADTLDGGGGDDAISPGGGADDVVGGAGVDAVFLEPGDDTVRLDGLANDGRPDEDKNIHADIEVVDGGRREQQLVRQRRREHAYRWHGRQARRHDQRHARRTRRRQREGRRFRTADLGLATRAAGSAFALDFIGRWFELSTAHRNEARRRAVCGR